jgi:VWFA-related protein
MTPDKMLIHLAGFVAAVFAASSLSAQQPSPGTRNVGLNVIALDSQGNPVDDLTAADFQVSDQGKPQRIVSFLSSADPKQLSAASKPGGRGGSSGTLVRPLVILFDLLNANLSNRGFGKDEIERALEHMEASDFVYLYLLTNSGDLYPVHPVPSRTAETAPDTTPWTAQIRPMLEDAVNKVYGLRPVDESQVGIRIESTYKALDLIASVIGPIPGPKNIIWITHGVPTIVRLRGGEPYDYSPRLQRLATAIDRAGISITVVNQGSDAASGSLNTLEQFTELTGGQISTRGVETAISSATTAARSAYRIEYVQPVADDKFHKIKVTCTRKGVRLQTKQGYYAYR